MDYARVPLTKHRHFKRTRGGSDIGGMFEYSRPGPDPCFMSPFPGTDVTGHYGLGVPGVIEEPIDKIRTDIMSAFNKALGLWELSNPDDGAT